MRKFQIVVPVLSLCFAALFYVSNIDAEVKEYKIGDPGPAGGWIFYDKGNYSDGWRYLEASPKDLSHTAVYGCANDYSVSGNKGTDIGTGKANTKAILKGCKKSGTGAMICSRYRGGGKSDWFLPSKGELNEMYKNLFKKGIGDFDRNWCEVPYLSSSGGFANSTWCQNFFYGGSQEEKAKNIGMSVRAVREF